jgi:hypothetical protein
VKKYIQLLLLIVCFFSKAQEIAVLKYEGGGDWYSNPTALPNLIAFCNKEIHTNINPKHATVESNSMDIFEYPFLHMTGHGNVFFSDNSANNIRQYLLAGGFIHIDDNYGMKKYVIRELKKIFPEKILSEVPAKHPIYHIAFEFQEGLPKIHEHDNLDPKAMGYFHEGRLVLLFTYETDLGDGWEDQEVHNDPENVRIKALQMGANIIKYAFEN